MPTPQRKPTSPVLLIVLVPFLAGAVYLFWEAGRAGAGAEPDSIAAEVESLPLPDTYRHHDFGQERQRQAEVSDLDAGVAAAVYGHTEDVLHGEDSQTLAMRRTLRMNGDAGITPPFYPTERRARLTRSEGSLHLARGESCDVRILPVRSGSFNCLVRVRCGDEILYPDPGQGAGYVPCELENGRPVATEDRNPTQSDGDPMVSMDLRSGIVRVQDVGGPRGNFVAELRIENRRL